MKISITRGFVGFVLSLSFCMSALGKDETPKVPRGTFHVNDLEEAKAEAVKKKLPICYMVG